MKTFSGAFILLFISCQVFAQLKNHSKPVIIQGRILNCPEKHMLLYYKDITGSNGTSPITLDDSGKFYLKTYKITSPQQVTIARNNIQVNDIFTAPGYNLTIIGDFKDFATFLKTITISGIGAAANQYRLILNVIAAERKEPLEWFRMDADQLLRFIRESDKLKDSIFHAVFDKKPADQYFYYFASLVKIENQFQKLGMLTAHVNDYSYKYGYDDAVTFITNNFDTNILDSIDNAKYLISDYYKSFIRAHWLRYLVMLDIKKDSTLRNQPDYKFIKANNVFTGKVKELVLFELMQSGIRNCATIKELNQRKTEYKNYLSSLTTNTYKKTIEKKFTNRQEEILRSQAGNPAPLFTLESDGGKLFSLADLKGKVVYLDLWASWCKPCRAQTPALRTLYNKFKNDDRIVFISIAVSDGVDAWRKAIAEDKAEWIQLRDKDDIVRKAYVANSIPQFVLIDKQGNIVDFDAPAPSTGEEIEKLLRSEMVK